MGKMTLAQAARKYKQKYATLKAAVISGRLVADKDDLTGNLWVVTDEEMQNWMNNPVLHKSGPKTKSNT